MKNRGIPVVNVGISLVILVFINLCLVTFSVLSLQNGAANQNLSRKAADHTTAYYDAVNRVQVRRREQAEVLEKLWKETKGSKKRRQKAYREKVKEKFAAQKGCQVSGEGELYFSFQESVSKQQELTVVIRAGGPEENFAEEIISWKLQASGDWEADRSLKVYKKKEKTYQ